MNNLSLFSGIGGLELGFERAGMTTVGQVEKDEYCQRVLAKHWPDVPRHDDVRTCVDWWLAERRPHVDMVSGGFPCQGHSVAGKQLGTDDPRWGWPWFRDTIDGITEAQNGYLPFVVIENVPNLVRTGLLDVLQDLATRGFDAWWGRVPAAAVGAPHLRWRIFVIAAHAASLDGGAWRSGRPPRRRDNWPHEPTARMVNPWDRTEWALANTIRIGRHLRTWPRQECAGGSEPAHRGFDGARWALADAGTLGLDSRPNEGIGGYAAIGSEARHNANGCECGTPFGHWPTEPNVGRVANGVPARVDRLRALGNAVVPQVAEYVGRLIINTDWVDMT